MKQETYLVWFQLNGYVVIIIINRMKREKIININEWCLERKKLSSWHVLLHNRSVIIITDNPFTTIHYFFCSLAILITDEKNNLD